MFHCDEGLLRLTTTRMVLDSRRRHPCGWISHAHADHMARHELAFCTPQTAALYRHRLGDRKVFPLPYRVPTEWGGQTLTSFPAGHCLGSALLRVEEEGRSLLYTGDYKLGESATAERAELPPAEVLIMECTFGRPEYVHPPREEAIALLLQELRNAWNLKRVPVVLAYELGKAQEATKILTDRGVPVFQSPSVYAISQVYKAQGVDLGNVRPYAGYCGTGTAVVVPPHFHAGAFLAKLSNPYRIGLTGWATGPGKAAKFEADAVVPLSDHADYPELLESVRRVAPKLVLTTHGPAEFAADVRNIGFEAHPLEEPRAYLPRLRELGFRV